MALITRKDSSPTRIGRGLPSGGFSQAGARGGRGLYLGLGAALGVAGAARLGRMAVEAALDRAVRILTQDAYEENWVQGLSAFSRVGMQNLFEVDLRAGDRHMLRRPLGSPKRYPGLDRLMFSFAQLDPLPTPADWSVNTRVVIGPYADYPLEIDLPVMVGGMGYGVSLSKEAKIAIARGATLAGTATNTGEGPFLPEERAAAEKLVVQYHRGNWMPLEALEQADMVEIHVGQGASGSVGSKLPPEKVTRRLTREMGLAPGEPAFVASTFEELAQGKGLAPIVDRARYLSGGRPVVVKLAASHRLEKDLAVCLKAGVDGVVIDGAQAGTGQAPPIVQDDFGIPTLYALLRARKFLDRHDPERRVSLIVSGGLVTPGDFLKCLALGADAVYAGTAILLALMAGQQHKATPGEPPTQVITYQGKRRGLFSIEKGAENVGNFLLACRDEIEHAVRQLGKDDVRAVDRSDLCALDDEIARITGLPVAYAAEAGGGGAGAGGRGDAPDDYGYRESDAQGDDYARGDAGGERDGYVQGDPYGRDYEMSVGYGAGRARRERADGGRPGAGTGRPRGRRRG